MNHLHDKHAGIISKDALCSMHSPLSSIHTRLSLYHDALRTLRKEDHTLLRLIGCLHLSHLSLAGWIGFAYWPLHTIASQAGLAAQCLWTIVCLAQTPTIIRLLIYQTEDKRSHTKRRVLYREEYDRITIGFPSLSLIAFVGYLFLFYAFSQWTTLTNGTPVPAPLFIGVSLQLILTLLIRAKLSPYFMAEHTRNHRIYMQLWEEQKRQDRHDAQRERRRSKSQRKHPDRDPLHSFGFSRSFIRHIARSRLQSIDGLPLHTILNVTHLTDKALRRITPLSASRKEAEQQLCQQLCDITKQELQHYRTDTYDHIRANLPEFQSLQGIRLEDALIIITFLLRSNELAHVNMTRLEQYLDENDMFAERLLRIIQDKWAHIQRLASHQSENTEMPTGTTLPKR